MNSTNFREFHTWDVINAFSGYSISSYLYRLKMGIMKTCLLINRIQINPRQKTFLSRFAAVHPLREIFFFFAEKNKNHLCRRGFSPRIFEEKLRKSSRRNSATFRGDTPRDVAEKFREISRQVGKDLRFLYAGSEDSDQTEKLSECPARYESLLDGSYNQLRIVTSPI